MQKQPESTPVVTTEALRILDATQEDVAAVKAKRVNGSAVANPAAKLPRIRANNRELRDLTAECLCALQAANDPPTLFVRAGLMAHVVRDERGRPCIRSATEAFVRSSLTRAADFYRATKDGDQKSAPPPLDAVRDILARPPQEWRLPPLAGVIEAPVIRPDGAILLKRGYDPTLRVVYVPSPGLVVPPIPERPSRKQLAAAVAVIDDAIGEFPYGNAASRANAIAMLLTPLVRRAISGSNVPAALIDAPQPGSGKTLLADVVVTTHTGTDAAFRPAPGGRDDEEWRKSIAAILLAGRPLTVFDNVERTLESPSLGLALTGPTFATRILGKTEDLVLPQETVFVITGNNLQLGGDLARRCYWIRLDARSSRPWQGRKFKHPKLKLWVRKHRGELLAALLTLTRGWYAAGKPAASTPVLGSFETWCSTVGGILEHAGVAEFLGNLDRLYEQADPGEAQWTAFLARLHKVYSSSFTIARLIERLDNDEDLRAALPDELAEADGRKLNPKRISWAFRRRLDRRHGDAELRIVKGSVRRGVATWRVLGKETGE
jgi:hypothetical protein